jgi:hypothetical protein
MIKKLLIISSSLFFLVACGKTNSIKTDDINAGNVNPEVINVNNDVKTDTAKPDEVQPDDTQAVELPPGFQGPTTPPDPSKMRPTYGPNNTAPEDTSAKIPQ